MEDRDDRLGDRHRAHAGLGTTAGLRPSLTLAVIGMMSSTEWGAHVNGAFSFLHHWLTISSSSSWRCWIQLRQDHQARPPAGPTPRAVPARRRRGGGRGDHPLRLEGHRHRRRPGPVRVVVRAVHQTHHPARSVPSDAVVTLFSLGEDLATFLGSVLTLVVPYFGYVATRGVHRRVPAHRPAAAGQVSPPAASGGGRPPAAPPAGARPAAGAAAHRRPAGVDGGEPAYPAAPPDQRHVSLSSPAVMTMSEGMDYGLHRHAMVEEQIARRGVHDQDVLAALRSVPRHLFVPTEYRHLAYTDGPLPIGYGQTISQPYIVALMSQVLELQGTEKVLEVGTGSGYQAAVLAELADEVYAMERIRRWPLRRAACWTAWASPTCSSRWPTAPRRPEEAPFTGSWAAAAAEAPPPLLQQLAAGGR